jgi:Fe-S-cluster-containing dehydrogenase component
MHCDNPPCEGAAHNGAVVKRDDGIVLILPEKAQGQKQLVASCPYGAIWWNEELQLPQKCTFCAHLIDDGWKEPRCVQACPTGALRFFSGDDEQLQQVVAEENLQTLKATSGGTARPRCWYKNLHRFDRCFISGSVARLQEGVEECAGGVRVALKRGEEQLGEIISDEFGDFKFDNLPKDSGEYQLDIFVNGKVADTKIFSLGVSASLGTILLE